MVLVLAQPVFSMGPKLFQQSRPAACIWPGRLRKLALTCFPACISAESLGGMEDLQKATRMSRRVWLSLACLLLARCILRSEQRRNVRSPAELFAPGWLCQQDSKISDAHHHSRSLALVSHRKNRTKLCQRPGIKAEHSSASQGAFQR